VVKDVISGFFLLLENQVRVGDVVVIGGTGGLVEAITLRTLVLRDLAGNVHIIPHGGVNQVTNMTKDYSRCVFDVGVAYREDPDHVMAVLQEIGAELQRDPAFSPDILAPLEMLGVDKLDDSAVIIKCRMTTKPIQQWRIAREMNRRIKKTFDARGIEIPFPHRTLYWGVAKDGTAPVPRLDRAQAEAD
jgi:small conductance mechanosensitive channel